MLRSVAAPSATMLLSVRPDGTALESFHIAFADLQVRKQTNGFHDGNKLQRNDPDIFFRSCSDFPEARRARSGHTISEGFRFSPRTLDCRSRMVCWAIGVGTRPIACCPGLAKYVGSLAKYAGRKYVGRWCDRRSRQAARSKD